MDDIWKLLDDFHFEHEPKEEDNSTDKIQCCHCDSSDVILEDGNYICKSCNTINSRFIDQQAEWRYYGNDDNKSSDPTRCGAPTSDLLPNSSLGSIISCQYFESYSMKLIRKYHMWNSMTYKERSLYNIFDSITTHAVNNGIPPTIIEEAKNMYKTLSENKISRGDNRNGLIASSIYMSCKRNKVPRSSKEIAKIFNLKSTVLNRNCKRFSDVIKMDLNASNAEDFIERFCSKLQLDSEIREISKHIISRCHELNLLSSNTPPSLAAAAICLAVDITKSNISKKTIADVVDLSAVTILKSSKTLYRYRGLVLSPDTIYKYSVV